MKDDDSFLISHEQFEREKSWVEETGLRTLAFVIHRFCGDKIEFTTEDICSTEHLLDIRRTYCDGKITYVTRLASPPPEDVVEEIEPL